MRINLLPPEAKIELFQEEIKKLIIILGILGMLFFISLTLILFSVKTYISTKVTSYEALVELEEKQLETSTSKDLREKVTSMNKTLSKLNSFYNEQTNLIRVFETIADILPSKMYLVDFSYQEKTSEIVLSGFAPYRESLLEFKKNIEKEFPDSYFPPQNWIKSKDIDFQVKFKTPSR